MFFQKRFHGFTFISRRSISDQDERVFDLAQYVFQSAQQFFGIDRVFEMSFVDLARNRQANHRRDFSAEFGDPLQLRSLAFRRQGKTDRF